MKAREDIINQYYINASDIKTLLKLPRNKAKELYDIVDKAEQEKRFRPHPSKVPLDEVLQVAGVNYNFLLKQIKNEGGKKE